MDLEQLTESAKLDIFASSDSEYRLKMLQLYMEQAFVLGQRAEIESRLSTALTTF